MSLYEDRIDRPVADHYADTERYQARIEAVTGRLSRDEDVLIEGLGDALYHKREEILAALRGGDLLEAMRVMHAHATTTYITDSAETIVEKEFYQ